jgi:V/A-type H+-transporting ATPase subunit I
MSPVTMRKIELHVLKRDTDRVIERLGASGCFQLSTAKRAGPRRATSFSASLQKLRDIRDRLGLETPQAIPEGVHLPGADEEALVERLAVVVGEVSVEEESITARREQIGDAIGEARAFAGLALPFRELDHLSFLSVRIGKVPAMEIESIEAALGERAIIVPIDREGTIVAAASKKGRFALDTELKRANFHAKEFPPDFEGIPPELLPGLESESAMLERRAARLAERKAELAAEYGTAWRSLAASYSIAEAIEEVKTGLESSEQVYRLEGWVPKERLGALVGDLRRVTAGRVAVRTWTPAELDSVRDGTEKVPVLLKRRPFVSSFERLVISYGAPMYGTIDPTPIVACFFVLLFAVMFGDVGQGLVIMLTGFLLSWGRVKGLRKFQKFGPIFVGVGLGSMVMGFFVGSVFSNEEVLVPLTRRLSAALLGHPVDRFLTLMPSGKSIGRLFAFFGFTLSIGVILNSIGLVINMVNKWRLGKRGEALFGKTGLTGAFLFWWAVGLGVRVILGGRPAWFDVPALLLPIVGLFMSESLAQRVEGRHEPSKDGLFSDAVKGFVEVLESVSYYFSNTLSFLRVGAFALSHTVLSFIVFAMGDLVRERAPGGLAWEILIVLFGNAIILFLEGMIVAIQVVRLNYYEFFSKFFTETGVEFCPFRFEYSKE